MIVRFARGVNKNIPGKLDKNFINVCLHVYICVYISYTNVHVYGKWEVYDGNLHCILDFILHRVSFLI